MSRENELEDGEIEDGEIVDEINPFQVLQSNCFRKWLGMNCR